MPMADLFSQLFTAENYPYIMFLVFYMAIVIILIIRWQTNKGKFIVRIHKPLAVQPKLVKPDGGKLPVISGHGRRPEWSPEFSNGCMYQVSSWMGLSKRWAVDVKEKAEKCIDWSKDNPEPPTLSKEDVKAYSEAQALKAIGKGTKLELPFIFWLSVIGSVGSLILLLIMAQRMGIF